MGNLAGLVATATSTQILTEGYTLEADNKGFYGNIRFWFLGADLTLFSSYVAGHAQTVVINGTSYSRLIPLLHPYIANCYCDQIKIYPPEGSVASLDSTGAGIAFSDYFADVHFSTPSYDYEGGMYPTTSIALDGGAEMVTRPGSAYSMLTDGLKVNHDVGVPVQVVKFTLTMQRLPALDTDLYFSLSGCTNATVFYGQDPGKVLYEGPGIQGQSTIGGLPSFDVAQKFIFRSIPHNMIMRSSGAGGPNNDGFDTPVTAEGGTMLPSGELNQLWGM